MRIEIQLTREPIRTDDARLQLGDGNCGALAEFTGVVRGEEEGRRIAALEYEAYDEMAVRVMRQICESLGGQHPCAAVVVIHRVGVIPVGEAAIYICAAARHRAEAFAFVTGFMDRLKQDVPIWKRRSVLFEMVGDDVRGLTSPLPGGKLETPHVVSYHSMEAARAEIESRCLPLPPVRVALSEATGRVLRETVCAPEDLPATDKSTRDGYAILRDETSEVFRVVDTLHAADWKPRQLERGEAVRVATGASLPCAGLRVVMQEHAERSGDLMQVTNREAALNLRSRGEDAKAGQPLVSAGARLDAGKLALLATSGCARPLVNRRLRVLHFTTGDEVVPPEQTPKPGQIRDSNSFLIRGLLPPSSCELKHQHLPENFNAAYHAMNGTDIESADVILISGGASVGDTDYTRAMIEKMGFQIVFRRLNLRPGAPLIFGVNGARVAFGLPGNPLSHFVCFHAFVAMALARLAGMSIPTFMRGRLAAKLSDAACSRETLWPARLEWAGGEMGLRPLPWASSGDVTCFASANALLRVPANSGSLTAGSLVEFLPTEL